jgi:hypothetical protein
MVVENKVEAAYRRGDLFEKRRDLMNAWELFILSSGQEKCAEPLSNKKR